MSDGLSNGAIGCGQTQVHQRDGDGVRGYGGQRRYLPHRAGLPRSRRGARVRSGVQRHRTRGTGAGNGRTAPRPPPTTAPSGVRSGGRASRSPSGAGRRGTPTRVNGLTTSTSAGSGGPARRCRRPRWCAGNWPGCRRWRWSACRRRRWRDCSGTGSPRSGPTWPEYLGNDLRSFVRRTERNGYGNSALPPRVMIGPWSDLPWNGSATTS